MGSWRNKLAELEASPSNAQDRRSVGVAAEVSREARLSAVSATDEEKIKRRTMGPGSEAESLRAVAELRQTQAERRRKLAEVAATLQQREEETDKLKKEKIEEERQKNAQNEEFFMRWLNDAEQQLSASREQLEREQALAAQAQSEAERTVMEMRER